MSSESDTRSAPRTPATGEDGLDASKLIFAGLVGMITVGLAILAAEVLFHVAFEGEWRRKVIDRGTPESLAAQAEQRARLDGYRYVDRAKGLVAVPIERAMELVVRERGGVAPVSGGRDDHDH